MRNKKLFKLLVIVFTMGSLFSCSPTKQLKDGEYLLTKNKISSENKKLETSELYGYLKQKPNRKILGVLRFHLRVYSMANRGKETKLKKKIKDIIGEPPVVLDTNLIYNSSEQLKLYLQNKGYFHAEIKAETDYYRKKKARVEYIIEPGLPYTIRNVYYRIQDPLLKAIVLSTKNERLFREGDIYDVDIFEDERNRISNNLKNDAYFGFSQEFIFFKIDSNLNSRKVDIYIEIRNPVKKAVDNPDSLISGYHRRYRIHNIYVIPEYKGLASDTLPADTMYCAYPEDDLNNQYIFLTHQKPKINPSIIAQSIYFEKGEYFKLDEVNRTYKKLSDLRNFKFININFVPLGTDSLSSHSGWLDCYIRLSRDDAQAIVLEPEITNAAGNFGVDGNVSFQHKNIFHGAEILSLKLRGAMEIQKVYGEDDEGERVLTGFLPFNTVEAGAQMGLTFPRFLLPVKPERFSKSFNPKSHINTGFNFQKRPDYKRYITNASFGYKWRESSTKQHIFNPLEISSVKIYPDSLFLAKIEALQDEKFKNSYRDHLITAMQYTFTFNNQNINKLNDFIYFRGNIESAGNLLRLSNIVFNSAERGEIYKIMNIRYAQYVRLALDLRYYHLMSFDTRLAMRINTGIGIPYGNADVLPFEKSFFVGGANSIRAWRLKTLGPGSYSVPDSIDPSFDRLGDIFIEASVEYRFPIYKYFLGAIFVDAGNVWIKNKNDQFPGGEFNFTRFPGEIAIGGGIGLRLDLGFFTVRLDGGIPLKDPAKAKGERWLFQNQDKLRMIGNIGIGYPF